jgi:anti-sigma factor RsiW
VIGHLGPRISALLDGQLSAVEEERAWEHVHSCHQCRDEVEREGWVKTRLSTMQYARAETPSHLKGSLMVSRTIAEWHEAMPEEMFAIAGGRGRRHLGLAGIGGGAVGAAVMGVLALGASPANAPGSVDGPAEASYRSSLTDTVTAVVDRTDPRAAQSAPSSLRHQTARSRSDVDPILRALRRTLAQ